jgi:2-polyprenyl-3-methyl-5-hydroxy-6-metoxy-1,4-benzoquinol methylase
MELLSPRAFDAVYHDVVGDLLQHLTPEMEEEIVAHHQGSRLVSFDLERYLRGSSIRFHTAYRSCCAGAASVCDIGGPWGAFPMTLRRLGFSVTMMTSPRYYGDAFDPLFEHITDRGVEIVEYDPFVEWPMRGLRFDAVTVMSVLEHAPQFPGRFMENVISLMGPDAAIYIEAPNSHYLPRTISAFLGRVLRATARDIGPAPVIMSSRSTISAISPT